MLTEEQRKTYKRLMARVRVAYEWSKIAKPTRFERLWKHDKEQVQRVLDFVRSQKVGKICAMCGESDTTKLCFHHVDPTTKLFNVGGYNGHCRAGILEEIAKCILLCRACHQRHHKAK